jgi:hypothetical protein
VTEAEWLRCADPDQMLAQVGGPGAARKLRLFACACCRRIWHLLDGRSRRAVEACERLADGAGTREELQAALAEAEAVERETAGAARAAARAAASVWGAAEHSRSAAAASGDEPRERLAQADLVREIFGTPARPLAPRPFPAHVVGLARACHAALPATGGPFAILADALEELGEEDAARHCQRGGHVRGCHVLDWALSPGHG